jgi:hypothetical protein
MWSATKVIYGWASGLKCPMKLWTGRSGPPGNLGHGMRVGMGSVGKSWRSHRQHHRTHSVGGRRVAPTTLLSNEGGDRGECNTGGLLVQRISGRTHRRHRHSSGFIGRTRCISGAPLRPLSPAQGSPDADEPIQWGPLCPRCSTNDIAPAIRRKEPPRRAAGV